jgi:hypothetical protein
MGHPTPPPTLTYWRTLLCRHCGDGDLSPTPNSAEPRLDGTSTERGEHADHIEPRRHCHALHSMMTSAHRVTMISAHRVTSAP